MLSIIPHHLNWTTSLLFNPLRWVTTVSITPYPYHWPVWLMNVLIFKDYPQLQSVKLGGYAFYNTTSLVLNNLPSLQSIEVSNYCFHMAQSFILIGLDNELVWIRRSSSTTISKTRRKYIQLCSFDCVWEWLKRWIDDSELPKLQSIQLGTHALQGDGGDDRKAISTQPYNWKNTLTMRSEIE